jgi:hypothetical protein
MKATVVLPIPFDNWNDFGSPIWQFTYTWKLHPPGIDDYQLIAVANWGEPTDSVREQFYGIKTRWIKYCEAGADIGSHMEAADLLRLSGHPEGFMVCMSSRCFFHRAGWLKRFVEAREKHGPGIYGTGVLERVPHIRTCAYGIDANFLHTLPGPVTCREHTIEIESGSRCLTGHVLSEGGKAVQVLWDDEQPDQADWRHERHQAIFRRGEQSAMLAHDRHTKLFEEANDTEKARLSALSDGK